MIYYRRPWITEDKDGNPATKHTTSPVMFICSDKNVSLKNGGLCDVTPTILDYMKIEKPKEMIGKSLLNKK